MALADTVQKLVHGTVNKAFKSFQATVIHKTWIRSDGFGKNTFEEVTRHAIVQEGPQDRKMQDGSLVHLEAVLTFLEPILPNGAVDRQEPIDPKDEFTLPSGYTWGIVKVSKDPVNPKTNAGFLHQVWLG